MNTPLKIMVLAGGPDREHAVSLKSGAAIAAALTSAGHNVTTCDLTPQNPQAIARFQAEGFDVIFPALHGPWGEGGGMQTLLEEHTLPYVGCQPEAARCAMDKALAKEVFIAQGLRTPAAKVVERGQNPIDLPTPCVVKPVDEGSSIDLSICHAQSETTDALTKAFEQYPRMLVEQYIDGREFTVGVLGTGEQAEALPPIEIRPAVAEFDYDAKYVRDDTDYLFDTTTPDITAELKHTALAAHRAFGCRDLSRSDFMLDTNNQLFLLETNTLPGFTDHSLLPKAAAKTGLSFSGLCDRLARWAVNRT